MLAPMNSRRGEAEEIFIMAKAVLTRLMKEKEYKGKEGKGNKKGASALKSRE